MNFNIETETTGLRRTGGLQTSQFSECNRRFLAFGHEPGIYQMTAFTLAFASNVRDPNAGIGQTRHSIVSEMLRIEVFPLLEIYPNNLLITPNMRYTL